MAKALVDHIEGLLEQAKSALTVLADTVPEDQPPVVVAQPVVESLPATEPTATPVAVVPAESPATTDSVMTPTEVTLADSINLDDEKLEQADEAAESAVQNLPINK